MTLNSITQSSLRTLIAILLLFGFTLIIMVVITQYRMIDPDEGFYLESSKLVSEGQIPYFSFFFQQGPLVPFLYGSWVKIFGATWPAGRGLSALMAAAIGWLTFLYIYRETRSLLAAIAALALYVTCGFILAWFTVVKTYVATAFFLFVSYIVLCWPPLRLSSSRLVAAGLLFGLATAARSYVIVLAPVFLVWILTAVPRGKGRIQSVVWFLVGFAVGYSPCIILFLSSPDVFLFDNLGYHAIRSSGGLIGDWDQKISTLLEMVHLRPDDGLQLTALTVVSFMMLSYLRRASGAGLLALASAATLALVSLLPTPTFPQYFALCMPFLIVSATLGVFFAASEFSPPVQWRANIAVVVGLAAFGLSAFPSIRFFLHSYKSYYADGIHYADFSLTNVRQVSNAVDRLAATSEEVASFWPGYLFQTRANILPPFNNDFGWVAGAKLTPEARLKYKVGSPSEIEPLLDAHTPRIVVVGNQFAGGVPEIDDYKRMLAENGYTVAETVGGAEVFVHPRN